MLLYCLKCRKKEKVKTVRLNRQIKEDQCFYQNVWCVISAYPEFFWLYWYMYRDQVFKESIGERTVRQTD